MRIPQRATAVLGLVLTLTLGMTSVASAADHQVVRGDYLELISVPPDGADRLSPGDTVEWVVGISAPGAKSGSGDGASIDRALQADGDLTRYLQLRVARCAEPAGADCTGGSTLVPLGAVRSGQEIDLGSQAADEQEWLLVQVRLPEDAPATVQSLTGSLRLTARGAGEELAVSPGEESTGRNPSDGTVDDDGLANEAGTEAGTEAGSIDDLPPVAPWLPGTGVQPALWLLAAGSAVLVGAALRTQRRVHPAEDDADEWSRS